MHHYKSEQEEMVVLDPKDIERACVAYAKRKLNRKDKPTIALEIDLPSIAIVFERKDDE